MVGDDERDAPVRVHLAAQFSQALPGPQQGLRRGAPQCEDHRGTDQGQLAVQVRQAGRDFIRQGLPVLRWPALDDVGDIDRFARQVNRSQDVVQERPRASHERPPRLVLGGPRPFPDEQQPRPRIALPRHRIGPAFAQAAAPAPRYRRGDCGQRLQPTRRIIQQSEARRGDGQPWARDGGRAAFPLGCRGLRTQAS